MAFKNKFYLLHPLQICFWIIIALKRRNLHLNTSWWSISRLRSLWYHLYLFALQSELLASSTSSTLNSSKRLAICLSWSQFCLCRTHSLRMSPGSILLLIQPFIKLFELCLIMCLIPPNKTSMLSSESVSASVPCLLFWDMALLQENVLVENILTILSLACFA